MEELEEEICKLKEEVISIKRMVTLIREPIIIERLNERSLTKREKNLMREALRDLKMGRKDKFVTLNELKKKL